MLAARSLAVLLAVLLAGCTTPPPPAPDPVADAEPMQLVVAVDELGPGFNPHLLAHQSTVTTALATLVLPSVFRPDGHGGLVLDRTIATSAEVVSDDPFTVSYELNLKASWSTNTPIAAEDFVYLWEQMRAAPGATDAAGYRLITDVRSRAGGKAVDVVFEQPHPAWRELFANLLPAHILKDAPGSWTGALAGGLPASGGPFRIASVDLARGDVVLARNDLYWADPAVLDQIVLRRLDRAAMRAGLDGGDVDIALPAADPVVRQVLAGIVPGPRVQPAPRPVVTQLGLRSDDGPLADPRARQGVAATVDRAGIRAAVAPEALPADALGIAPSQPGYAPTTPPAVRPDPAAAQAAFTAAGWSRGADGRWRDDDGDRVRLVVAAPAERQDDVEVAGLVATQLDAAGIDATVVAPPSVDLFAQPRVPAVAPSSSTRAPSRTSTATTGPSSGPAGPVQADIVVTRRTVGDDPGTQLASDYGCGGADAGTADPAPAAFCFPALEVLLDQLVAGPDDPVLRAVVEDVLWQQLPALPLFQPVNLVVSTPAADVATGIGPGPLKTGPLTGAQRWSAPRG